MDAEDMRMEVVAPEVSQDSISEGLRIITKAIIEATDAENAYGLGGPYGYGASWDSKVFMMHPYCWCERDDCPWCATCTCPDSAWTYKIDGKIVSEDEYIDFMPRNLGTRPPRLIGGVANPEYKKWMERAAELNRRRSYEHTPVCPFCLGTGVGAGKGAEPGMPAPNFWHKRSNMKVWWYKYIGRGMKVRHLPLETGAWEEILAECLRNIRGTKEEN